MIERERYLAKIRPFYNSDLIKIVTGIRRSGKSVLLSDVRHELQACTDNIIALDFEDAANSNLIPNALALLDYVEANRRQKRCYVFLDEVQRLDGWADACRTLRLRDCSVFISGSNSKLLSGEFTKELSGRFVSFRVRPFVYQELSAYAQELGKQVALSDYLVWGGFPKRLEFDTLEAQKAYLNDLNETIIINDLVSRYAIRKRETFVRIANYIFLSNARVFSARSIAKAMRDSGLECSTSTVIKFLSYLQEAFAIDVVKLYSNKAKRELAYYQKVYNEDVSLGSIRAQAGRFDLTHNLENIVFNELKYRDYDVFVYNDGGREIDFIAIKGNKKYYLQVAYSLVEPKTYERELSAFATLDNDVQKIIITTDDVDYSTSTVRHISLQEFLMMDEL